MGNLALPMITRLLHLFNSLFLTCKTMTPISGQDVRLTGEIKACNSRSVQMLPFAAYSHRLALVNGAHHSHLGRVLWKSEL